MSLDKIVTDSLANGAINASSIAVNSIPSSRLTTTGVVANSYGNSSQIPVFTVDAAGRISNATVTAVAGVTGFSYSGANNTFSITTGDGSTFAANISANSIAALAIGSTGVVANSYGNSSQIPVITIDEDGRISNATVTAVAGVTNFTYESGNNAFRIATGDGSSFAANLPYRTDQNLRTTDAVSFGNTTINGNLTVTGVVTTVNTVNLSVQDNMIYLNANSIVTNPDLGFAGNYNDGSYAHAGFFRDATDARWKVFDNYSPEPDASPYIDTANASFHLADLQANVVYANVTGNVTGNVSGSANSATYLGGNTASDLNTYASTAAGTAYTNAVSQATTLAGTAYSNAVSTAASDATTKAGTAYSNAVSQATSLAGTAYSNAVSTAAYDATTKAGTAYSNAVSYAGTIAGTAYSNAVSVAATDATNKAANAYANAVTYADNKVANLVNSAPAALDTLLELAAALGNDANFSTTVTTGIGNAYTNAVSQATTLAGTAYSNAVSYAGTIAGTAYTNAASYAATIAGTAYSNATTFASNASNISSGTLSAARLPQANSTSNGAVLILDSVSNTATSIYAAAPNSVKTAYELAGNAVSNAVSYAATAYSNATSYAATIAGTAYSNAVSVAASDATSKAATAYSNATSYAATIAGTAYSNATSYAATIAGTAYSNAVSYAASNSYVNSTFLKLSGGTMTGSVANASFTGTVVSAGAIHANGTGGSTGGYFGMVKVGYGLYYGTVERTDSDLYLQYTNSYNVVVGYGGGYLIANNSVRAPIFYDSDNTSYYTNPASTSALNVLTSTGGIGAAADGVVNDPYGFVSVSRSAAGNYSYYGLTRASNVGMGIGIDTSNQIWFGGTTSGYNATRTSTYFYMNLSGDTWSTGSSRAPIFYDSDNTSYYTDPSSTSILNAVTMYGNLNNYQAIGASDDVRNGIVAYDSTSMAANVGGQIVLGYKYTAAGGYTQGAIVKMYKLNGTDGDYSSGLKFQVRDTGEALATRVWIDPSGNLFSDQSVRAPIFYDSDNTSYYVNPASSPSIFTDGLIVAGNQGFSSRYYASGRNRIWSFYDADGYGLSYFQGAGGYNSADSMGIHFGTATASGSQFIFATSPAGTFITSGSVRSPIFYDSDDTGYYANPNSTSSFYNMILGGSGGSGTGGLVVLYGNMGDRVSGAPWYGIGGSTVTGFSGTGAYMVQVAGYYGVRLRSASNILDIQGSTGRAFDFNGDVYAPLYYDSDNTGYYTNPAGLSRISSVAVGNQGAITDGTYAMGLYHNSRYLIGLRSTSGEGYYPWLVNDYANSYDALILHFNGIGDRFSFNRAGVAAAAGDFRAPIFYDSDDTSYYIDAASSSGSRLSHLYIGNVAGSNDGSWNARAKVIGSYHARLDVVSNSDSIITTMYSHTGQGVGRIGTSSNHPLALMAESSNIGGYVYSGSIRAPIFYDSDDTSYYVNPNGSSQFALVYANDWFRAQGSCGLYFQDYGRGLRAPDAEGSSYGNVSTYGSGRGGWRGYAIGSRMVWMSDLLDSGSTTGMHDNTYGWIWRWINESYFIVDRGYSVFSNSARSPIFYDYDNTGYYVDPNAGTSINVAGAIQAGGNITAYYSDERLKTKLGPIENAVGKVKQLNGFYYHANEVAQKLGYKVKREVGLSAQDIQAVLPEIVAPAPIDNRYLTIDYERVVPLLVEAIKEQQNTIDRLEALVNSLINKTGD